MVGREPLVAAGVVEERGVDLPGWLSPAARVTTQTAHIVGWRRELSPVTDRPAGSPGALPLINNP
jgi:hypothetical protein